MSLGACRGVHPRPAYHARGPARCAELFGARDGARRRVCSRARRGLKHCTYISKHLNRYFYFTAHLVYRTEIHGAVWHDGGQTDRQTRETERNARPKPPRPSRRRVVSRESCLAVCLALWHRVVEPRVPCTYPVPPGAELVRRPGTRCHCQTQIAANTVYGFTAEVRTEKTQKKQTTKLTRPRHRSSPVNAYGILCTAVNSSV